MIKLIVGLGNPGSQYEKTRHNAGFLLLDSMLERLNGQWRHDKSLASAVAEVFVDGRKVLFQKPLTFMNKSGDAVVRMAAYYKIAPEQILVIHDELDFEPGVIRLKKAGGHAGHNGLRDIIQKLGSRDFYRLRIGIGRPPEGWKVSDYVLSAMGRSERQYVEESAGFILGLLPDMLAGDLEQVMNVINAKKK